jgi:hypothetical protein
MEAQGVVRDSVKPWAAWRYDVNITPRGTVLLTVAR